MYRENRIPRKKEPCNRNMAGLPSCISDTRRSRPAPPAEHAMIYDAEHPNGITFPEYANAIRKDEREKVLNDLLNRMNNRKICKWGETERDLWFHEVELIKAESLRNEVKRCRN